MWRENDKTEPLLLMKRINSVGLRRLIGLMAFLLLWLCHFFFAIYFQVNKIVRKSVIFPGG